MHLWRRQKERLTETNLEEDCGSWRTVDREMKGTALIWNLYNDKQLTEITDDLAEALCAPMHDEDQ